MDYRNIRGEDANTRKTVQMITKRLETEQTGKPFLNDWRYCRRLEGKFDIISILPNTLGRYKRPADPAIWAGKRFFRSKTTFPQPRCWRTIIVRTYRTDNVIRQ